MEDPKRRAIGVAILLQSLGVGCQRTWKGGQPDLLRPLLFDAEDMKNDPVSVTPSASRTLLHLSRPARADVIEERPARLHQAQFVFQFCIRHVLAIDAGKRERD